MTQNAEQFAALRASPDTHIDALAALFDTYRQFYRQPADLTAARRYILERLTKDESVIFIAGAKENGQFRALGFTQLYPTFSSISMKPLWILNDLFVAPEARKRGIGAALLEAARAFAVETGAQGLILETAVDNYEAQRLYEAVGYKKDEAYYRYSLDV